MKRKKHSFLIWVLLTCLMSCICIYAHPGRTDANGGHWDRKNGTYHFHTGEYAGRGSSSGYSSKDDEPFVTPYAPPTENPYKQENNNTHQNNSFSPGSIVAIVCVLLIFVGPYLVWAIMSAYNGLLKLLPKHKINKFAEKLHKLQILRQDLKETSGKLFRLKTKIRISVNYKIGKDHLPKEKNCVSGWGQTFTLYRTSKGTKFHAKYNCCFATIPVHVYNCQKHYDFSQSLCAKCAYGYTPPDMTWYELYLEYKNAKKKIIQIDRECELLQKEVDILHRKCNSLITSLLISFSDKNTANLRAANNLYIELKIKKE